MSRDNEFFEHEEPEVCSVGRSGDYIFKTLCLIQAGVLAVAVIWGLFRKVYFWNNVRLDSGLLWGVAAAIFLSVCSCLMYAFRKHIPFMNYDWIMEECYKPMFGRLSLAQIAVASVLSGVCEEALFRGVMMQEWGAFASSVIFGTCHLGDKRLIASSVWIAAAGYGFSLIFGHTGNLGACMIAHCMNNFISFLFVMRLSGRLRLL